MRLRREHEGLLVEWARAGQRLLRWVMMLEGSQAFVGFGLAGWLLFRLRGARGRARRRAAARLLDAQSPGPGRRARGPGPAIPDPSQPGPEAARAPRRAERTRATGLPERRSRPAVDRGGPCSRWAWPSRSRSVDVRAGGQPILESIEARIEPGSHVAIVGPSGAGKSSLVGLLLGWHRASAGRVLVDGAAARRGAARSAAGRRRPGSTRKSGSGIAHCWRTCSTGMSPETLSRLGEGLREAELLGVLKGLPGGLQNSPRRGGRPALRRRRGSAHPGSGRALIRPGARLVILDEPFRGLDRDSAPGAAPPCPAGTGATRLCSASPTTSEQTRDFEPRAGDRRRAASSRTAPGSARRGCRLPLPRTARRGGRGAVRALVGPDWQRLLLREGRLRR